MIWSKPIIGYRNQIASLRIDVDRCDLVEDSCLTDEERETIRKKLGSILSYIDKKLSKTRPK